jgi:hypothetical protein
MKLLSWGSSDYSEWCTESGLELMKEYMSSNYPAQVHGLVGEEEFPLHPKSKSGVVVAIKDLNLGLYRLWETEFESVKELRRFLEGLGSPVPSIKDFGPIHKAKCFSIFWDFSSPDGHDYPKSEKFLFLESGGVATFDVMLTIDIGGYPVLYP